MKNKKGWLRIVEAFIAILLILATILIIYRGSIEGPKVPEQIYSFQKTLLDEIASNETMRNEILSNDKTNAEKFIGDRMISGVGFEVKICKPEEVCPSTEFHEEMFSSERIISVTLEQTELKPKKIKIFMWTR